ncbi:hypothetical protein KAI92_00775 [Candidatus Parcubacteria bacterium]|nr:hypothetical protein [Candidatus Parcubacteria bacterium]
MENFGVKIEANQISQTEKDNLLEKLENSFFDLDIYGEKKQEFNINDMKINFEFSECEFNYVMDKFRAVPSTHYKDEYAEEWKELKNLKIKTETGTISFLEWLPDDWKIIVDSEIPKRDRNGDTDFNEKIISLGAVDLSSLQGIITLAHEIGHVASTINTSESEMKKYFRNIEEFTSGRVYKFPINKEAAEDVISKERDAWAVAFKILKPLIKSGILSKNNLVDYVHKTSKESLSSYSDHFKWYIDNELLKD